MPTPDFVLALREKIGHDLLWMSGVTAIVVTPDRSHVLVVRRADTGAWTPVTGIIDPGEQPARAAVREVLEEAGIRSRALRLVEVRTLAPHTFPNGDEAQFLDLCFLLEAEPGEPYPADGENLEACFVPAGDLPPMNDRFRALITRALSEESEARFHP